jgi:hypothetical protein
LIWSYFLASADSEIGFRNEEFDESPGLYYVDMGSGGFV